MSRLPLIGAAGLALAACTAGPGRLPAAADVSLPPAFRFAPDAAAQGSLQALLPVDDPAYRTLASLALSGSPSVAAALARVDIARAQADRARAETLPALDGSLSADRSRASSAQAAVPAIPGIEIDRTRTTYGANLSARWDPDLFGGLRAGRRAAEARVDAADASAAATRLALLSEIAGTVTDWRTLAARDERLRQDLAAAERLTSLAGVRERAGLSPGIERVQAQSVAASSRTRLEALASERARLVGRLVTLTARPASEVEGVLATTPPPPAALPPPPAALPSTLLSNRPDILAAGAQLRAANAEVAAAAAQRFPRLTLSSALGLLALSVGGLFDTDALTGSAGAGFAGPLLDFGRVAAEIDRAEAGTAEAFANYRDALFTALGDAEGGYALVAAADRELAAAVAEASATDRAARLSETRFRAGLSSFLDVLDARRLALAAGERVAAARGRSQRARIALWQALGGG